jgi:hypothetical protein
MAQPGERARQLPATETHVTYSNIILYWSILLLNLVAAVGRGEVDNQFEFVGGVVDILLLENAFLCFVGPSESLVHVQAAVDGARDQNQSPTHHFQHLETEICGQRTIAYGLH